MWYTTSGVAYSLHVSRQFIFCTTSQLNDNFTNRIQWPPYHLLEKGSRLIMIPHHRLNHFDSILQHYASLMYRQRQQ
jgi:hypothetical protein